MGIIEEINKLKRERNAIILAHNYQKSTVQDIADFVGDSLKLAQEATRADSEVIVFCGVTFMAETAKILNPDKKILIPDIARCSMAQLLSPGEVIEAKKGYPGAEVVLYINTLAESKAEADCMCTSANATEIVNSMDSDLVLFGPDKNLADYVRGRTKKTIISIPEYGLCPTHHQISKEDVIGLKNIHPDAKLVVHPECILEVQRLADHIASTDGMIDFCKKSESKEFIIGTENGILHRLRKEIPKKKFYPASSTTICPDMKMITLEKIKKSLEKEKFEIIVPKQVAERAERAIERMLELS